MTKIILVPSPLNAAWNNNTNNFTEVKCFIYQTLKKLFQEAIEQEENQYEEELKQVNY